MAMHHLGEDSRLASVGAAGDASTTNSLQGKLGDPTDTAVAPGSEGTLFAHGAAIYRDVIEFEQALFPHDPATNVLDGDPTNDLIAAASSTQAIVYTVLDEVDLEIPTGYEIVKLWLDLTSRTTNTDGGGGGNGDVCWYIVDTANKVGAGVAVSGDYEAITDAQATATGAADQTARSGFIKSALVTGPCTIAFAAKVDDAQDTCAAEFYANVNIAKVAAKR